MIESLLYLVIYLMVLGVVAWLLIFLVQQLPLPSPMGQVIRTLIIVVMVIIAILLLLRMVPLPAI